MSKPNIKQKVASDYTPEFRVNAIKLAQSGEKSFAQTAKDLGYIWRQFLTYAQESLLVGPCMKTMIDT